MQLLEMSVAAYIQEIKKSRTTMKLYFINKKMFDQAYELLYLLKGNTLPTT